MLIVGGPIYDIYARQWKSMAFTDRELCRPTTLPTKPGTVWELYNEACLWPFSFMFCDQMLLDVSVVFGWEN